MDKLVTKNTNIYSRIINSYINQADFSEIVTYKRWYGGGWAVICNFLFKLVKRFVILINYEFRMNNKEV